MNRRRFLHSTGAAAVGVGLSQVPIGGAAAQDKPRRHVLFFTRSAGFEHPAIKRKDGQLSFAEQLLTEWGGKHGFEVTCSKDGSIFTPEGIAKFDAFVFYTTGVLTEAGGDKNPPMSAEGKQAFLEAIRGGKGFVGTHSASDTFHTQPDGAGARYQNYGEAADPYIKMIGGEFIKHGKQQKARMRCVDNKFPGFEHVGDGFDMMEEWYSLKEFQKDLHVLLVQETEGMEGADYQRGAFPATWARRHGRGRVFYTSMGHREDVWTNPTFQSIFLGGIAWAAGNVRAEVRPNIEAAAPRAGDFPPRG